LGGQALTGPDPLRLNELGLDALEASQLDQAIQYLTAATEADPSEPTLWMNLAKAHRTAADDEGERAALHGCGRGRVRPSLSFAPGRENGT